MTINENRNDSLLNGATEIAIWITENESISKKDFFAFLLDACPAESKEELIDFLSITKEELNDIFASVHEDESEISQ